MAPTCTPVKSTSTPAAVFDHIADFLELCRFKSAAASIRAELKDYAVDIDLRSCLKDFVDGAQLILSEMESGLQDQKLLCEANQDVALDRIVEGLIEQLLAAEHQVSDDQMHMSIAEVLGSSACAKATSAKLGKTSAVALPLDVEKLLASQTELLGGSNMKESPEDAASAPVPLLASPHYHPRRRRTSRGRRDEEAQEDEDVEEDEYHDDEDAGYRIREIYEAELLAELSHKMASGTLPLQLAEAAEAGSTPAAPGSPESPTDQEEAITKQPAVAVPSDERAEGQAEQSPDHVRQPQFRRDVRHAPSGDAFYPVELEGTIYDSFNLRVVFERDKTGFEESKEFAITMNSVVGARYQIVEYLGSAAFSRAVQCLDLETNKMVCMKIIKNDKDFFDQSLDEIKLLKFINVNAENGNVDEHGVLALYDYFYHKEHLIIVTELLRDNLYEFSKFNRESGEQPYFTLGRIQKITKQVLRALEYVHSLRLIHCDLKPENILIKSYSRCEVKVIDFGSSCFVDDHLSSYVQSRSYRAPEVMLGLPYGQTIDMWSLGCIIAELWTGYVLFQNDSVQSLLARILGIIGPFPTHLMMRGRHVPQYFTQDGQLYQEIDGPACPDRGRRLHLLVPKKTSLRQRLRSDCEEFIEFVELLLQLDPEKRPSATDALQHPFIASCKFPDGL